MSERLSPLRAPDRRLDWPGCRNARDLGGLPTADGGMIRPGALVRSDDPGALTADGLAALRAYGISRVIDLRNRAELRRAPSPFADEPWYVHAPLVDEVADRQRDLTVECTVGRTYRGSVLRNAGHIVAGVAAIADAPPGGVLVHCHVGKDRTGMVVALVLRAMDVPLTEIAADYALTAHCLRDRFAGALAAETDPAAREKLRDQHACDPQNILGMLAQVTSRYGDVPTYLRKHGLTEDQIVALRDRLRATG